MMIRNDDLIALVRRVQSGLPYQLSNERRTDALGPADEPIEIMNSHFETSSVQLKESPPTGGVGEWDLDGLIDTARPRRKRGFQDLGTIGRQKKEDIGIVAETVHLIEQLEQQYSTG